VKILKRNLAIPFLMRDACRADFLEFLPISIVCKCHGTCFLTPGNTMTYCNALQHIATQRTATHYSILQHSTKKKNTDLLRAQTSRDLCFDSQQ